MLQQYRRERRERRGERQFLEVHTGRMVVAHVPSGCWLAACRHPMGKLSNLDRDFDDTNETTAVVLVTKRYTSTLVMSPLFVDETKFSSYNNEIRFVASSECAV